MASPHVKANTKAVITSNMGGMLMVKNGCRSSPEGGATPNDDDTIDGKSHDPAP